jgi:hypothetical protein
VREGLARRGVAVRAGIGFGDDVADRVVGEGLGDADPDARRC